MRFGFRKLLIVVGGAAIFSTAGFAYMASNSVAPSYAGEGTGVVNGYQVYDVHYTQNDTPNGNIGYIHFDSVPLDGDHTTNSWPVYGQVYADGTWFTCTASNRTNSWTAPTGSPPQQFSGQPQANWICDVRGTTGGIPTQPLTSITFMILA